MRTIIKYLLLLLLFETGGMFVNAQPAVDSPEIKPRVPTAEQIDSYRKQNDFNYEKEDEITVSWLDEVLDWISRQLEGLFSDKPSSALIRYLIIAGLIIFVVLTLLKVKPQSLFYKNRKKEQASFEYEELALLQSDLEDMARKEIANKNFRLATRYLFLKLLKLLDEKEIIRIGIQKTNYDYLKEVRNSPYHDGFKKLSTVFEFLWYGNFSIEEPTFQSINQEFQNIYSQLNA